MSFISMVIFMVKWAVAAIPALFILMAIWGVMMMLLGGMTDGFIHGMGRY